MVANRLSDDGKTWTDLFARNNSGTYNNQFQILDLKLIDTDKKEIKDGALWVIEQIPTATQAEDVTRVLRYGYWPSYNSAYFKPIREKSGYESMLIQHPEMKDILDYSTCARANIFRREQGQIKDVDSYKRLIRLNDFKNDPLSKGDPGYAIASRRDLDTPAVCSGATDAKFASINEVKGKTNKKIHIIAGPTADKQIPFDISTTQCSKDRSKYSFDGLPTKWNFKWIEYQTTLFDN